MFKSYCATVYWYIYIMWFNSTVTSMNVTSVLRALLNLLSYNNTAEVFMNLRFLSFCELFVFYLKTRINESDNLLVNGHVEYTIPLFSTTSHGPGGVILNTCS